MFSFTVSTEEQEDSEVVLEELVSGFESRKGEIGDLGKCVGILFVDANLEYGEFIGELERRLGFLVLGNTAVSLVGDQASDTVSAILTVMCDAEFGAAATGPLDIGNTEAEVGNVCKRALTALNGDPKAIFVFCPIYADVMMDDIVDSMEAVAGKIPVFGGVASDNQLDRPISMFYGGEEVPQSTIVLALGGDIDPVFEVANTPTMYSEKKGVITESGCGFIQKVGDQTFKEFMEYCGLRTDKEYQTGQIMTTYATNPVKFLIKEQESDGVPVIHNIFDLNRDTGSIFLAARIPEGSEVSLCLLKKDNIKSSTQAAMEGLVEQMKERKAKGSTYSMLFAISCGGRYFVLTGANSIEREILNDFREDGLSIAGFYASGEIGPTSVRSEGAMNRTHHSSLVLCAF
ncbi:MAG: FIST C-terminal domain-containing protein [Clostridiales bacterium]|nr:FIST C-terminal domain-containing protein [Clostridiales bacterium]